MQNHSAHRNLKELIPPAAVLVLCMVLFVGKAVTSLVQESSTWDETCYFGLGKYLLQNRRWDVPGSILHPPLSYYIHSIPLLFIRTDQNPWKNDPLQAKDRDYLGGSDVLRGQALLSSPQNEGDRLLDSSRFMMVLTGVLLGCFVWLWSYQLYGRWSAMLAAVLFAFSPNILAHARLITPDITVTTFLFITLYYLWRLQKANCMSDALLGGACLGLALLSKFTSLLLLPICPVLIIVCKAKGRMIDVKKVIIFGVLGLAILYLGYGMHLTPYIDGILYQHEHENVPYRRFLMGHYSSTGWWCYYIVAFLIKTPIPTILFLAVSLACLVGMLAKGEWIDEAFLLFPAGVILCFFSLKSPAIGLRYILPIYPFLFVFASGAVRLALTSRILSGLYVGLIAWYVAASGYIHPHYLAYFNELVGGPGNGYKCLVDSNLDWGQDLKGLKEYMREHGISRIALSYFGSDTPERYGIAYDWLPSFTLRDTNPQHHELPRKGYVAISATNLQGVYFDGVNIFAWLKAKKPIAKIGYSIFIYKLDE